MKNKPLFPLIFSLFLFVWLAGCAHRSPAATGLEDGVSGLAADIPPEAGPLQSAEASAEGASPPTETAVADGALESADIWARIRAGYALAPQSDSPRVDAQFRWYAANQAYLDRVTARAQPYFHFIVEEIAKRGMPLEVALLPIVESAFDPFAYSHGRAAGLWQFIPGTGRRYALTQNWWYDGRRDVAESTRAALDYLQDLHAEFDDWLLALAAYNCGEGNVRRAIRRNTDRGLPTDFWHLKLPRETSAYVPKLLALKRLVADPAAYGIELAPVPDEPYLARIELESQIDLALAADLAGIPLQELYLLNPGFNRWATAPEGPHNLFLPLTSEQQFLEGVQTIPADERVRWQRHKVRSGETLGGIARRYATTVEVLQDANGIRNHIIRAGNYLMVPTATQSLSSYSLSEKQRIAQLQNIPRGERKVEHVVHSGESFWTIARHYGVSVRQLAQWNGMAPADMLPAGHQLVLWLDANNEGAPLLTRAAAINTMRTIHYTVRRGDSLTRIAAKFGVSVQQLANWNALNLEKYLQPGQRLKLLIDVTKQSM